MLMLVENIPPLLQAWRRTLRFTNVAAATNCIRGGSNASTTSCRFPRSACTPLNHHNRQNGFKGPLRRMTRGLGATPPGFSPKDGGSNADEQKKPLPVATEHEEEKGVIANLGPGVAAAGAVMMGGFYGADILGYVSGPFQSVTSQHRPILCGHFVVKFPGKLPWIWPPAKTHRIGKRCISNSGAATSSTISDAMH
jgi:hypothetical protein